MKICRYCHIDEKTVLFNKNSNLCKSCSKAHWKQYYIKNQHRLQEKSRDYHKNNKAITTEKQRAYYKKNAKIFIKKKLDYYYNNKNKIRQVKTARDRYRRKTDPFFKLKHNLRIRLNRMIDRLQLGEKTSKYGLNFDKQSFITHMEALFQPGMTWDNHGLYGWHIDHIIPLSSAKNIQELHKLNDLTNLQPLWAKDNISKSNK